MDRASTHLGTWQDWQQSPNTSRLLFSSLFLTRPHFSVTMATVFPLHQLWNRRIELFRNYQLVPGGTQASALSDWVQQDLQLNKQLVHKNARYAAAHEGSQQVVLRRRINNDNNDKGNTSTWDVTCLCDGGAWEKWQRPRAAAHYQHGALAEAKRLTGFTCRDAAKIAT